MSFQSDKSQLESSFNALQQQSALTFEKWNDPVQRRFYEQFLNSFPKDFYTYINELNKLDKSFEKAERNIGILQE